MVDAEFPVVAITRWVDARGDVVVRHIQFALIEEKWTEVDEWVDPTTAEPAVPPVRRQTRTVDLGPWRIDP